MPSVHEAERLLGALDEICAMMRDDVQCWGLVTLPNGRRASTPTSLRLGPIRELAIGGTDGACAVLPNGKLFCWDYLNECSE